MSFPIFEILNLVLPVIRAVQSHPSPAPEQHDLAAEAHNVATEAHSVAGQIAASNAVPPATPPSPGQKLSAIQRALEFAARAHAMFPDAVPTTNSELETLKNAQMYLSGQVRQPQARHMT